MEDINDKREIAILHSNGRKKTVSFELLILCLAYLEPRISKAAYMKAKFKNAGEVFGGGYEQQMKLYMGHREKINFASLCSACGIRDVFDCWNNRQPYKYKGDKMDKSYKLKLEKYLSENKLNQQLLINCLAKFDNRANKLSATMGKFKYNTMECFNSGTKEELQKLIDYRNPFIKALSEEYFLSVNEIKSEIADILQDNKKNKNIPDYKTIDVIRKIILSGDYVII